MYAKIRNGLMKVAGRCHLCVLVYHRVSDEYRDAVTVGVAQFIDQMELVKKHYKIISAEELVHIKGNPIRQPLILITFDDGYQDNFQAATILKKSGIEAIFFVTTRYVGSQRALAHDMQRIGRAVPMLSWEEIRHMVNWGHSIGNHSAEHKNLAQIDTDRAIEQIVSGQKDLRLRLGGAGSQEFMAYPFGRREDLPAKVKCRLNDLGIKFCFSAYGGINRGNFDNLDIRRQGIDYSFDKLAFRAAIEGWETRIPPRAKS